MNKMEFKTWYHALPECGRLLQIQADDLSRLKALMYHLQLQMSELQEEYNRRSAELDDIVKGGWSDEDITAAKLLYLEQKPNK